MGLRIFWAKTKFMKLARDTADQTYSVAAGTGKLVEVVYVFPYLGIQGASDWTPQKKVYRRLGIGIERNVLAEEPDLALEILFPRDEDEGLQAEVLSILSTGVRLGHYPAP